MALLPALCLCLLLCSLQSGSEVIRKTVREDQDVVLECARAGTDLQDGAFDWRKTGGSEVFYYTHGRHFLNGLSGQDPNFKGRVFHFPQQLRVGNASILIRKTTLTDNGNYTCKIPKSEPEIGAQYELIVGAARRPFITHKKTKAGVLLQCDVERASPRPRVEWRDSSGNVLQAEETVTHKDSSFDVHLTTTVKESGKYRCVATQEEIYNQVFTETYVPNPASKPSVTNVGQTNEWALLQCEVFGASPKPVVVWKNDAGTIINSEEPEVAERGGSYDVVLKATVTENGFYHCVATQEEHSVSANINVFFGGPPSSPVPRSTDSPTGWKITAAVLGILLGGVIVVLAVLKHFGCIKCNRGEFNFSNKQRFEQVASIFIKHDQLVALGPHEACFCSSWSSQIIQKMIKQI